MCVSNNINSKTNPKIKRSEKYFQTYTLQTYTHIRLNTHTCTLCLVVGGGESVFVIQ